MSQKKDNSLKLTEVETSNGSLLVPYELRRSRRSRYIRLTIGRHNQALLSIPWRCPLPEAMHFLRSQGDWIEKNLRDAPSRSSLYSFLENHPRIFALGNSLRVSFNLTKAKPFYVYHIQSGEAEFRLRRDEDREDEIYQLIREFATEVVTLRTKELAGKIGKTVKRVSVRDQSSRWGSCSSSGTVSLNWRLVLLRPNLQDHVIYHELAHLTEMNHSPAFWNLLTRYDPQTEHHNAQLNPAAARLMPLGRR